MKKQIVKRFTQFINEENNLEDNDKVNSLLAKDFDEVLDLHKIGVISDRELADYRKMHTKDSRDSRINSLLAKGFDEVQNLHSIGKVSDQELADVIKIRTDRRNINEGDNPVHNLVRTAHNRMTGKHTEPVDFESEFNKLTDDDKDHFKKIANRTKDFRKAELSRNALLIIPTYYRNNPKKLLHILEDECFTPGSQLAAEIVDEFVNDDNMTIDDLAQTVSANATHRGGSPERITKILTMYAK
jgi:hypothetical protein